MKHCDICGNSRATRYTSIVEGFLCDQCFSRLLLKKEDRRRADMSCDLPKTKEGSKGDTSALNTQEGGSHYKGFAIQPVEFIHKNSLNFCQGNAIKYIVRYKKKNGIEDLRKAKHYLELLCELEYKEEL